MKITFCEKEDISHVVKELHSGGEFENGLL